MSTGKAADVSFGQMKGSTVWTLEALRSTSLKGGCLHFALASLPNHVPLTASAGQMSTVIGHLASRCLHCAESYTDASHAPEASSTSV